MSARRFTVGNEEGLTPYYYMEVVAAEDYDKLKRDRRIRAFAITLALVVGFALGAAWGYEAQVESCGQMVHSGEVTR